MEKKATEYFVPFMLSGKEKRSVHLGSTCRVIWSSLEKKKDKAINGTNARIQMAPKTRTELKKKRIWRTPCPDLF